MYTLKAFAIGSLMLLVVPSLFVSAAEVAMATVDLFGLYDTVDVYKVSTYMRENWSPWHIGQNAWHNHNIRQGYMSLVEEV